MEPRNPRRPSEPPYDRDRRTDNSRRSRESRRDAAPRKPREERQYYYPYDPNDPRDLYDFYDTHEPHRQDTDRPGPRRTEPGPGYGPDSRRSSPYREDPHRQDTRRAESYREDRYDRGRSEASSPYSDAGTEARRSSPSSSRQSPARRSKQRRSSGKRVAMTLLLVVLLIGLAGIFLIRRPGSEAPSQLAGTGLERKENTWTFLITAEDQSSGNTDTIMVCTYDTKNQQVGMVSVPRDTLVDREGWSYHKINAAYPAGNNHNPPDGGITELKAAVSEVLGIPIDHYVIIDPLIFVDLVDAVNGIDFDVPVAMSYDDPTQDLHIHFEPGMQHLTGQQALEVARCRNAYADADIGRTRTQQALMKAIIEKVIKNPLKIGRYLNIFSERVKTDLSLSNMLWFIRPATGFDPENLRTATLPGNGFVTYKGTTYCYALYIDESLAIINDLINPYTTPVTRDMVRMVQG